MAKPTFTVIIPNYNGLKYMEDCMAALKAQSYDSFVVLIIDNGSTDGSREYLIELEKAWNTENGTALAEAEGNFETGEGRILAGADKNNGNASISGGNPKKIGYRPLKNILLDTNTGFSGAVNVGIANSDTEYVVLLNNDTKVHPDYLKELARVFEEDKEGRIFAVTPKMIQMYHPELLDDAGDGYNLLGWAFQRGVGQSVDKAKFNHRTKVFSACAGAAAYRKSVFEEIRFKADEDAKPGASSMSLDKSTDGESGAAGRSEVNGESGSSKESVTYENATHSATVGSYFDPMHFAYLEDVDVSFRARVLGYSIVYAPDSIVYHVGSGTSGSKYNSFKVRLAARNNVYLNYKNMPILMLLINLPGILAGIFIKHIFFVKIGFGRDYRSGLAEGLKTLRECHKHKTGFKLSRLGNYIVIELMLLSDTFSYIQDFAVRQAAKLVRKK